MVGRVLRNHQIVAKHQQHYTLVDFDTLSSADIQRLIALCEQKLQAYLDKRGHTIWNHPNNTNGYISGTVRYEVLKRAKFHCELCGIAADEKALEVDHIVPKNHGGQDDLSNFQALCYSCNAMKRDRDATDFRAIRASYGYREPGCLFCTIPPERIITDNELFYVIHDAFPVTLGHTLIIPKRHVATYFDLGQAEVNACTQLLHVAKARIEAMDPSVQGFNIGVNDGESAGQTIRHCHLHLIPRRLGDVEHPRGGIRHIIPNKGDYCSLQDESSQQASAAQV